MSHTSPVAPISSAVASMRAVERDVIATRAPSATSSAAIARPSPCEAPLTSATRPSNPTMRVACPEPVAGG